MTIASRFIDLPLERLGGRLRELANATFPTDVPDLDEAYGFLLANCDLFGYDRWPADMPADPPPVLADAYGSLDVENLLPVINDARFVLIRYGKAVTASALPRDKRLADAIRDFSAAISVPAGSSLKCSAWLVENRKAREYAKFTLRGCNAASA